ncbi:MAG: hypothetical protein A3F15_01950 [Candidatus Wildermuthbacteria bacterium RIFCSPHIGHO2_12_FULL_40_12]|uniref:DUF5659 domain-containing protein n=1 Tax=Candidatus Wildermuthbacteria bacterium RIFCSPHIGHO2_12_FULL_40_12 TaxID=1802457 RepID=A0A1G2RBQ3_9BACT|nr:MAG: hypothetical protein A3F15_01950 [Candidatus Wildermuthbacteria bacterium RIFCSPHIGHO2_12_FULL_40_12]HXK40686.1 DUF5659 domain-containing protein [Candidatus Paceibacterota bacterium]
MSKYYKTANFYQSTFLFSKGLELISVDRTDPKKCEFVFADTPERELLVGVFNFSKENDPETMVDFRKAVLAIKTLKNALHQP